MYRCHDPLRPVGAPLASNLPSMRRSCAPPLFQSLEKFLHFQPCFGQNLSYQNANFPNFRSQDPSFFKENPLPRPYFWKPVWHPPTKKKKKKKKKVECPPPPGFECSLFHFVGIYIVSSCWWRKHDTIILVSKEQHHHQ